MIAFHWLPQSLNMYIEVVLYRVCEISYIIS